MKLFGRQVVLALAASAGLACGSQQATSTAAARGAPTAAPTPPPESTRRSTDGARPPALSASAAPPAPAAQRVATIVTHHIDGSDPARVLPALRAAMPSLASCYAITTWIDVRLRVASGGSATDVEVVDAEASGLCVRDLIAGLKFPPAHGGKPTAVELGLRIGPPLADAALPPVGADEDLVRNGDGSCGATQHVSCPPGAMCPRPTVHAARCPIERPVAR